MFSHFLSIVIFLVLLLLARLVTVLVLALFGCRYRPRPVRHGYPFVKRVAASLTALWIFNIFRKGEWK